MNYEIENKQMCNDIHILQKMLLNGTPYDVEMNEI